VAREENQVKTQKRKTKNRPRNNNKNNRYATPRKSTSQSPSSQSFGNKSCFCLLHLLFFVVYTPSYLRRRKAKYYNKTAGEKQIESAKMFYN